MLTSVLKPGGGIVLPGWANLYPRDSILISLVTLGAWSLWKHRNRCVFDKCNPSAAVVLAAAREELTGWRMAGAKALSFFHLEEVS